MSYKTVRELRGDLLQEGDYRSIKDLLHRLAVKVPENRILGERAGKTEIVYYNSKQLWDEVVYLGDGLIAAGYKDAHIAIVSTNSCRYVITDLCVSSGVGVVVPIDRDAPVDLLATLLNKSDTDVVMCSSDCLERLEEARKQCPCIRELITMDKKVEGYVSYDEIVEKGRSLGDKGVYADMELDLGAPAKMLFTSGTTGPNKCVVLTNANLTANMLNCIDGIKIDKDHNSSSMSVLPMHHATEINTHILGRLAGGDLTYINDSIRNMMVNFKIYKPEVTTIVPMIANAFYKNIWAGAEKAGKADKLRKGIKISNFLRKFGIDRTHKMFKDVYEPFGGNLRMVVCGGSMLNPEVVKGLNDLGIRMENGYGITECGPLISLNADTLNEHLSVGKPCPSVETVILDPDENGVGELAVRSKAVAKGYYKDEEATAASFQPDGFFKTGDSAYMKDGKVFLVGKKKNTIVLANGKNVSPEEIENVLETNLPYATEVAVYQADYMEGKEPVQVICAGLYIADEEKRADRDAIMSDIIKVNSQLPGYKNIDYVDLMEAPFQRTGSRKIVRTALPGKCSGKGIKIF